MAVLSRGHLPLDDTVILHCPFTKYDKDDAGTFIGVAPAAFRVDPDGISVTWVEYFKAPPAPLHQAAAALKTERQPSKKGVLAHAKVGRILELARKDGLNAQIIHTPTDLNSAHSSIIGWPDDESALASLALAFGPPATPNVAIPGFVDP